jgi:protein-S-isoprenylcysteine O-methyltransferase Ste14
MIDLIVAIALPVLWLTWLAYWWYSARDVKPTRWREPLVTQLRHRLPIVLGALLLAAPVWFPAPLRRRFVPAGPLFPVLGVVLLAAGLGIAVWARRHLGRNWSSNVVVKQDHTLIRTGPYRRLRHPIYSGLLLAFLGTAVTIGEWRALLAFALCFLSFALKSRAEEARMRETFPEYDQYRRETSAIVPGVY